MGLRDRVRKRLQLSGHADKVVRDPKGESSQSAAEATRDGHSISNESGLPATGPNKALRTSCAPDVTVSDACESTSSKTAGTVPTKHHLWAEAYEALEANPDYSKLLALFKEALIDDTDSEPASALEVADDGTGQILVFQKLARRKLDELEKSHSSFSIGGKVVAVRDTVAKTLKVVSKFKAAINSAVSAEPHAALAWAAVMAILPLLENAIQQDKDAADGICAISFLLVRYQAMQEGVLIPELQNTRHRSSLQLLLNIREKLVSVYAQVYIYQMRFLLQYGRTKALRTLRNAAHVDNWKLMWAEIEMTERLIDQGVTDYMNVKTLETWKLLDVIKTQTANSKTSEGAILASVNDDVQTQLLLSLPHAANAIFNSGEVSRAETPCLEGTQVCILNQLQDWVEDPAGEPIYWLHGMAGTGKTSVALTVAEALVGRRPFTTGRGIPHASFLGASFFFKQGDATRNGIETFFPTIAICLTENFLDLKAHIVDAINKTPTIGKKGPQQQLDHLIVKPLSELDQHTLLPLRLVVVVDALDECINQSEAEELLSLLAVLEDLHQIQLRFLITSREDEHIGRSFDSLPRGLCRSSNLPKIRTSIVEDGRMDDITKYFIGTLAGPKAEPAGLPAWLEIGDIEKLSASADGLFIYAATACRFLLQNDPFGMESCRDRLEQLFSPRTNHAQQAIDDIYVKVLSFPYAKATTRSREMFFATIGRILGFVVVFLEPVSVSSLAQLLDIDQGRLVELLKRLHSILEVPEKDNIPLGFVHLSFRDFLLDGERSKELAFRVDEVAMHGEVYQRCLQLMLEKLHQDMCKFELPGHVISNADHDRIQHNVPTSLQYASRYWVDHLARLDHRQRQEVELKDDGEVHHLLKTKFLFWLEAMCLMKETPSAVRIMTKLQTLVDSLHNPGLAALVNDAKRFILDNTGIINQAPLQIYSSGLIFSPRTSIIRTSFEYLIPCWITHRPAVAETWTSRILTLGGHTGEVVSIAFSPVDNLIASGSRDKTTRVWDYNTGMELFKFDDSSLCCTMAFSPDGKRLASGLWDGHIIVRTFAKDIAIDLDDGYRISHVAFSPKPNNVMASGSEDGTLRIWNLDQKLAMQTIMTNGCYYPVAFSPRGDFVAVALGCGIGLWDAETGNLLRKIDEHGGEYKQGIAATMQGDVVTVISASSDHAMKWSAATGEMLQKLELEEVEGVGVSLDGTVMAVVSRGGTVSLYRADTWDLVKIISINPQHIWLKYSGLSLSRDGKLLALACLDGTVQVWDTLTNTEGKEHNDDDNDDNDDDDSFVNLLPGDDDDYVAALDIDIDRGGEKEPWMAAVRGAPKRVLENLREATFSPDKKLVALRYDYSSLRIWDRSTTREMPRYDFDGLVIFSPDSRHMALVPYIPEDIRVLETKTFKEIATLKTHLGLHKSFAFSPNGQHVGWLSRIAGEGAYNDDALSFHLWDLEARKELVAHNRKAAKIYMSLCFSPDGELVMFHKDEKALLLLEVLSGRERAVLAGSRPPSAVFHPESHLVATTTNDNIIHVWETASGRERYIFKAAETAYVYYLAFSIAARLVASSSLKTRDGSCIQMWDVDTGTEIGRYETEAWSCPLSFSCDLSCLESDYGRLPLPAPRRDAVSSEDNVEESAQDCVHVAGQWIVQGFDNKLIWLPPAYRATSAVSRGGALVIGHDTRPATCSFFKFDLPRTPRRPSRKCDADLVRISSMVGEPEVPTAENGG